MINKFKEKIIKIGDLTIVKLPKKESAKLPSRGMVMVEGTINGYRFQRELEPDGDGSHFLMLNKAMLKAIHKKNGTSVQAGDIVSLEIQPSKDWPEPEIPADLKKSLDSNLDAYTTWKTITPMARWDWIRWINATKNTDTRKIRIEKTFSKFKSGIRRPCCFNRTMCTVMDISDNGILRNN